MSILEPCIPTYSVKSFDLIHELRPSIVSNKNYFPSTGCTPEKKKNNGRTVNERDVAIFQARHLLLVKEDNSISSENGESQKIQRFREC